MALSKKDKAEALTPKNRRADGWANVLTGLSMKGDKTRATFFGAFDYVDDVELTRMWMGEGLGKKIVSCVADDMTRSWITIDGDPTNKIMTEMSRLNLKFTVNRAVKWMRLYRGSLLVIGYQDGQELDKPVNWAKVKGIDWIKDYPAPRIRNVQSDIVIDPKSPYFDDFEYFKVFRMDGTLLTVHRTRCIPLKGEPVPHLLHGINFYYLYWGQSALQSILQQVNDLGSSSQAVANLMQEMVVGKYKISNLASLLASNNTQAIYTRMEIINASKSIINGVLLGENEDYTRDQVAMTGVGDIMDRFMMLLSATANIPMTKLFGRAPAGLNATGESDLRNYYDDVQSQQEAKLLNPLQILTEKMAMYLKVGGTPTVKFKSLWEPTQAETVEMRNKQANTDGIYIEKGVLDPEEVRKSRFENGYNIETTLMDETELASFNESKVPGEEGEPDAIQEGQNAQVTIKVKGSGKGAGETPSVEKTKGQKEKEKEK